MYYCRICSAEYVKKNSTLPVPIEILQASLYCLGTVFFFFIPLEGMKEILMKERGWKRSCFLKPLYIVSEGFGEHQAHVAACSNLIVFQLLYQQVVGFNFAISYSCTYT